MFCYFLPLHSSDVKYVQLCLFPYLRKSLDISNSDIKMKFAPNSENRFLISLYSKQSKVNCFLLEWYYSNFATSRPQLLPQLLLYLILGFYRMIVTTCQMSESMQNCTYLKFFVSQILLQNCSRRQYNHWKILWKVDSLFFKSRIWFFYRNMFPVGVNALYNFKSVSGQYLLEEKLSHPCQMLLQIVFDISFKIQFHCWI